MLRRTREGENMSQKYEIVEENSIYWVKGERVRHYTFRSVAGGSEDPRDGAAPSRQSEDRLGEPGRIYHRDLFRRYAAHPFRTLIERRGADEIDERKRNEQRR